MSSISDILIEGRQHVLADDDRGHNYCARCDESWPCITSRLADALELEHAEHRAAVAAAGNDEPSEVDRIAETLGIRLLPWQRDLATRVLAGEVVFLARGRAGGMTMVQRVVARGLKERGE
ncbi:hypothetical protein [Agromyces sp. NPDC058104]|uniref:hypothetical protein n=1 Tax=Agromyces sp. NPDC058104 TaxID=3346342 RepID=UPI0036DE0A4F